MQFLFNAFKLRLFQNVEQLFFAYGIISDLIALLPNCAILLVSPYMRTAIVPQWVLYLMYGIEPDKSINNNHDVQSWFYVILVVLLERIKTILNVCLVWYYRKIKKGLWTSPIEHSCFKNMIPRDMVSVFK